MNGVMSSMPRFYYHEWTETEERTLAAIMMSAERKKVLERFNEAADKLQRTAKSCQNRWYEIRHKYESKAV